MWNCGQKNLLKHAGNFLFSAEDLVCVRTTKVFLSNCSCLKALLLNLYQRNFVQLCLEGYYNDTIFHRIAKGFIVQGGDPTGTGFGTLLVNNIGFQFLSTFSCFMFV